MWICSYIFLLVTDHFLHLVFEGCTREFGEGPRLYLIFIRQWGIISSRVNFCATGQFLCHGSISVPRVSFCVTGQFLCHGSVSVSRVSFCVTGQFLGHGSVSGSRVSQHDVPPMRSLPVLSSYIRLVSIMWIGAWSRSVYLYRKV